ncbi:hypothetical protein ABKV19_001937 [Rosa sericea]
MSSGKNLELAEDCLLYGISKLASIAKEQGKNNIAFLDSEPEAALMARSYLPSRVSKIVSIWRNDLNKWQLSTS